MKQRLRVAVIGVGRAGMVHAHNANGLVRGAELSCVVDADPAAADKAASQLGVPAFTSLERALVKASFEGVVITTPTFTHAMIAVAALQAGRHVFCEKPMALSVDECDEMNVAALEAGVVLQIGFVRRFQPEFVEAKRRVDAGDIGRPMVVRSVTRGPGLPPPWARDLRLSNGLLGEVNSHDFDCVRWFAGSDIERVYAETANVKGQERGVTSADFYDNAIVALRFASGAVGSIDGTCPADYGYDARVEVLGTEGLLVVGQNQSTPLMEIRSGGKGEVPTFGSWFQRFELAYREEFASFVDASLAGSRPAVGAADGRAAVAAVVASNRSWLEGRPIRVGAEGEVA